MCNGTNHLQRDHPAPSSPSTNFTATSPAAAALAVAAAPASTSTNTASDGAGPRMLFADLSASTAEKASSSSPRITAVASREEGLVDLRIVHKLDCLFHGFTVMVTHPSCRRNHESWTCSHTIQVYNLHNGHENEGHRYGWICHRDHLHAYAIPPRGCRMLKRFRDIIVRLEAVHPQRYSHGGLLAVDDVLLPYSPWASCGVRRARHHVDGKFYLAAARSNISSPSSGEKILGMRGSGGKTCAILA